MAAAARISPAISNIIEAPLRKPPIARSTLDGRALPVAELSYYIKPG